MDDKQDIIDQLQRKLEILQKRQDDFSREINSLRIEINRLKSFGTEKPVEKEVIKTEQAASIYEPIPQQAKKEPQNFTTQKTPSSPKISKDLEKFIGENLISKIGIAILVIGVGIGAKYSIEHDLISPLTRIILGYLTGIALLGLGIKLKANYESYSAVLVSGAIAIMYFITYAAYSFYGLIPQGFTFVLMVIFTAFTVVAATSYNKQVIAHIGLVGAYGIPFLLSEDSGRIEVLFSYMAIINIGILIIAFKKYWKSLYYSAFGLTWLVYFSWYATEYNSEKHFTIALLFLTLFFVIFYLTFLAYKLRQKENFEFTDVLLLVANSFIFYGLGYGILAMHETGSQLLGVFTIGNAIIHFIVSAIIYNKKLADKNLFYLVSGLVLVFITIAIPVQLDGNWVTLLWAGEAALLFWIGRTKSVPLYEKISYTLMALAFFSIAQDWSLLFNIYISQTVETNIFPIFNVNFLTSLLFISAFGFINYLNQNKKYTSALDPQGRFSKLVSIALPSVLLFSIYYAFRLEIITYWNQLYADSLLSVYSEEYDYMDQFWNYDLLSFKTIWTINYTLLFVSALALFNIKKLKNKQLGMLNLGLIVLTLVVFLFQGINVLAELRDKYLDHSVAELYKTNSFNIGIRYISFAFVALTLIIGYRYIRQEFFKRDFKVPYDFLLHATILFIASSELVNWLVIAKSSNQLGLSILWGIYALMLIALGIWKKKKHLRIGAIALFGITLLRLFLYDISHLDTIAKTIVFVSLGALLLIISFLYNKYKHLISDENNN